MCVYVYVCACVFVKFNCISILSEPHWIAKTKINIIVPTLSLFYSNSPIYIYIYIYGLCYSRWRGWALWTGRMSLPLSSISSRHHSFWAARDRLVLSSPVPIPYGAMHGSDELVHLWLDLSSRCIFSRCINLFSLYKSLSVPSLSLYIYIYICVYVYVYVYVCAFLYVCINCTKWERGNQGEKGEIVTYCCTHLFLPVRKQNVRWMHCYPTTGRHQDTGPARSNVAHEQNGKSDGKLRSTSSTH